MPLLLLAADVGELLAGNDDGTDNGWQQFAERLPCVTSRVPCTVARVRVCVSVCECVCECVHSGTAPLHTNSPLI